MATTIFEYYHENRDRFLQGLTNLLKIPSISTLPEHKPDIQRAAEFLANEFREMGMKNVEIIAGQGEAASAGLRRVAGSARQAHAADLRPL